MSTQPESDAPCPDALRRERAAYRRYVLGIVGLFAATVVVLWAMRVLFVTAYWPQLAAAGASQTARALLIGLRFSASAAAMLLGPALVLWFLLALVPRRSLRLLFCGYVGVAAFLVPVIVISDFLYFQESGKHFTYEATAYLGPDSLPMITGAFTLHPYALWSALAGCIAFGVGAFLIARRLVRSCALRQRPPRARWAISFGLLLGLGVLCLRGGLAKFNMTIGDAVISPDPYVNALCLDPVYAVFRTALSPEQSFQFNSEAENVRVTRRLVGCDGDEPPWPRYPLLRESPGTPQGNRMNVVLIVLESWSGKDIGCLGGVLKVTPFFDELAREGMLFTRACATGIRTAEGVFSMLCSFPNQPIKPIMNRYSVLQNRWRSLSQILEDAGYHNVFIHGRDLDFDHLRNFLYAAHFHQIIDRRDFPVADALAGDSWPGSHDEDVLRRADAEFAARRGRPFFAVIYTMNTHPPFAVPADFSLFRPPDSDSNRFLNALNYTDHCLGVFFDLARRREYFDNTLFILVADHARTRGHFTIASQHHIPLLIYAPKRVPARVNPAVASQSDLLPTVLGLLELKTRHAAWGHDLTTLGPEDGFAVSVAGSEIRWRNRDYLLNDGLTEARPMLFDLKDNPDCTRDAWDRHPDIGQDLQFKLRAYVSLSQTLLNENRAYPGPEESAE